MVLGEQLSLFQLVHSNIRRIFFRLTKICTLAPYCLYTLKILLISGRITQVWGVHTDTDTWVARGSERNSHSYWERTVGEEGIGNPMDMFL